MRRQVDALKKRVCGRVLPRQYGLLADERGVATVWAAFACAALIALIGLAFLAAATVQARHEMSAWADGAALAGAAQVRQGEQVACAAAADYLHVHTGEAAPTVQRCMVLTHPDTSMPAVQLVVSRPFGRFTITGRACAGPLPP